VAGESFANADGSSRQAEIARCQVGEAVTLEREPDNPHDENCVQVFSARGVQIGNLAREAAWIAQRLDLDQDVETRIARILGDRGRLGVVLQVKTDDGPWEPLEDDGAGAQPVADRNFVVWIIVALAALAIATALF